MTYCNTFAEDKVYGKVEENHEIQADSNTTFNVSNSTW